MEWSNMLFASELLGTFVLMVGILSAILYVSRNEADLSATVKRFFVPVVASVSLMIAVAVAVMSGNLISETEGEYGFGHVNPLITVFFSASANDWSGFLPLVLGQLLGASIGFALVSLTHLLIGKSSDNAYVIKALKTTDSYCIIKNTLPEFIAVIVFVLGVASSVELSGGSNVMVTAMGVGASLLLVLLFAGDLPLMINPAIGTVMMIGKIIYSGGENVKSEIIGFKLSAATNVATGIALGYIVYAIAK